MSNEPLYSAIDISKGEGLSVQAVYEDVKKKRLTPTVMTVGGRMLFSAAEVERYSRERAARKAGK